MQFEPFQPLSSVPLPTGFIRTISHQTVDQSIHLLCCEFDVFGFTEHFFSLYGIEQPELLQRAVPKRKAEFLAGRVLAKQALQALGYQAQQQQIRISEDRSPVWPVGVTGSITHTTGFAACCVATMPAARFIGIDSELQLSADTAQKLAADIHNQTELDLVLQAGLSAAVATSLIFSAKESLYKALYPRVRCFFGFETARVSRVDQQSRHLTLVLSDSFAVLYGLKARYKIQFCIKDQLVHTLLLQ